MKRLIFAILPVLILLMGCLKEKSLEHSTGNTSGSGGSGGSGGGGGGGSTTGYFLQCKINGTSKTFNVSLTAKKQDAGGGITVYSIAGKANSNATDLESFVLGINASGPLTATTYKVDDVSTAYTMAAIYNPNSQTTLISSQTGDTSSDPFQLTITSVSTTEVAGTFKGNLFEQDLTNPTPPTNPPVKSVTEGSFKVKFQ